VQTVNFWSIAIQETSWGTTDSQNYVVEYLMPEHIAPWLGAYVGGEARSIQQAIEMIRIGLQYATSHP
jgi:hypothetical protein